MPQYGEVFNPWRLFHGAYVPEAILRGRVSRGAALLYGVLGRFAGANGRAWPKYATLAVALGVPCPKYGEARSVRRWTRELVDKGLIQTTPRGAQTNSLQFEFLWSPLLEGQLQLDFGVTTSLTTKPGRRRATRAKPVENVSISSEKTSDTRPPLAGPDRPVLAGHSAPVLISEQESLEQESPVVEVLVDCSEATERTGEPAGSPAETPTAPEPRSKILPFARALPGSVGPSGAAPGVSDLPGSDVIQRVCGEFSCLGRKLEEARRIEGLVKASDIISGVLQSKPPTA